MKPQIINRDKIIKSYRIYIFILKEENFDIFFFQLFQVTFSLNNSSQIKINYFSKKLTIVLGIY